MPNRKLMHNQYMTLDDFTFDGTISRMGTKRQIIIPSALYHIIRQNEFENVPLEITIKKKKEEPKK